MRQLNWQLKQLCLRHPDGSFATQQDRRWTLSMAADDLDEMGYQHLTLGGLKPTPLKVQVLAKKEIRFMCTSDDLSSSF